MVMEENIQKESQAKELICFIIMPFSEIKFTTSENQNKTLSEAQLTNIYEQMFKRAVESYNRNNVHFVATRYTSQRGNFVKGIISDLDTSDLLLADLTGLNPNVFYELGVRHTLKCGTLMLTQNKKELASDLSNYIAIEYKYPELSHEFSNYYPEFEKKLHDAIDEVLSNPNRSDNPVRDFIGDRNIFRNEQRISEIKGNIELMELLVKEYLINLAFLGECIESWSKQEDTALYPLESTAEPFLNRLVILNERQTVIEFVKQLIRCMHIIEHNMPSVKRNVIKEKDPEKCLKTTSFGFEDTTGKSFDIWALYNHYKRFNTDLKTVVDCPIVSSFKKFIQDWKDELKRLMK